MAIETVYISFECPKDEEPGGRRPRQNDTSSHLHVKLQSNYSPIYSNDSSIAINTIKTEKTPRQVLQDLEKLIREEDGIGLEPTDRDRLATEPEYDITENMKWSYRYIEYSMPKESIPIIEKKMLGVYLKYVEDAKKKNGNGHNGNGKNGNGHSNGNSKHDSQRLKK